MTESSPTPRRTRRRLRPLAWFGMFALGVLLAAGGTYWYFTRPERLRASAEKWLSEFSGGEAHIERVDFGPLRGLSLTGVTLAIAPNNDFDPYDRSLGARTVFRSSTLLLRLEPLKLLRGRISVPEVVAENPELIFVQRSTDGVDNWQTMLKHRRRPHPSKTPSHLPVVQFRNARLTQYRLTDGKRIGGEPQTLWAEARSAGDRPQVYELHLKRLTAEPNAREASSNVGQLQIDMQTLAVTGFLPVMPIGELRLAATPEALRWMDLLAVEGSVQPEQVELSDERKRITLALSAASLAIPIDETEKAREPASRYLRFEGVGGRVRFEGNTGQLDLDGSFHGSRVRLSGSTTLDTTAGGGLDALAFHLKLEAHDILLPRDEPERDLSESRFVNRWKRLRNLVYDFDPVGRADLSVEVRKSAGHGAGIEFLDGELRSKGASARYIRFPYRVSNMTGSVRFHADGTESIDLRGLHDRSVITINGWEGGSKTQAGDLKIHGEEIALDDDLRRCLKPEEQRLCQRFGAAALMNLDVTLTRADARPGTPNNPWQAVVDVAFKDGSIRFDQFPYPLDSLKGTMRIAGGAFQINELTARRSDATVRVAGTARWTGERSADVDLHVEAKNIPFDSALCASLPLPVRERYRSIDPSGRFDLAGRLASSPQDASIHYDLALHAAGCSMSLPTAGRLSVLDAQLRLEPRRLHINSARAALGDSIIEADGWLDSDPEANEFSFRLASEHLVLDEHTRQTLPPALQRYWDDFSPAGAARLELRCERHDLPPSASQGPAVAEQGQAGEEGPNPPNPGNQNLDYRLFVEPLGASATYTDFPLPLQDLRGSFVATPKGVEITAMQGRSGDAFISFFGRVQPADEHNHVHMTIQARKLQFTDALRRALPLRLRRQWDRLQPRGEVDIELRDFDFTTGEAPPSWRFTCQADLRDVTVDLGANLGAATGSIRGAGKIGDAIALDLDLALQRIMVEGRLLTDVAARLRRAEGDTTVYLDRFKGRLYDGAVAGQAEIDYGPVMPAFNVELQARQVSLEQFLNARRDPALPPVQAHGRVDADLALNGRFLDPHSRRGQGQVSIREAQMLKIPWMLSILKVLNLTLDDNAFHDALLHFNVEGEELLLDEIDLRGKALSMVGGGRVNTVAQTLDLALLVGGPMRLPRIAVLSDLLEDVARELMEVRVEGTLGKPSFRADVVKSLRKTIDELLSLSRAGGMAQR